jgi:hypothetical protein
MNELKMILNALQFLLGQHVNDVDPTNAYSAQRHLGNLKTLAASVTPSLFEEEPAAPAEPAAAAPAALASAPEKPTEPAEAAKPALAVSLHPVPAHAAAAEPAKAETKQEPAAAA